MRLTNQIRDAFVEAAMRDVPFVNWQEKAQALFKEEVAKYFNETFPGADYDALAEGGWLDHNSIYLPNDLGYIYMRAPNSIGSTISARIRDELREYGRRHKETERTQSDLRQSIKAAAYACTNRKQLVEALPEFEKYLPAEPAAVIRTLPAVQNVVDDFRAAGWQERTNTAAVAA